MLNALTAIFNTDKPVFEVITPQQREAQLKAENANLKNRLGYQSDLLEDTISCLEAQTEYIDEITQSYENLSAKYDKLYSNHQNLLICFSGYLTKTSDDMQELAEALDHFIDYDSF